MTRLLPRLTLLFSLTYFCYYLNRLNYSLALPFIKEAFHVTNLEIGGIATALTFGYAIGQLVNGYFVDAYGPRLLMTVGGLCSAGMNLLMGLNPYFGLFLLIWALNGYYQACGYPATCKFIALFYKDRGTPLGISEMFQSLASILVIPLSALVALWWGWQAIFYVPSLILFTATFLFYYFSRPFQNGPHRIGLIATYRPVIGSWRLWCANLSYGFSTFVKYALITWIPSYLYLVTGHNLYQVAGFSMLFQVGGVLGSVLIGVLHDRFFLHHKAIVIAVGMLGAGLSGGLLGVYDTSHPFIIMGLLLMSGALVESLEVPYFLIPMDYVGPDRSATGIGFMNATGKFIASLQGVLLGFLIDVAGYQAAFLTAGFFGVIAAVLILPLRRPSPLKVMQQFLQDYWEP